MDKKPWFASWFDSPYYHLLYQHRSGDEADGFIPLVTKALGMNPGDSVLDLACGKGRHSRAFFDQGLRTTGVDLSPESIAGAKSMSDPAIRFEVADMRNFNLADSYDLICNLFTSFGYFEAESENLAVLNCVNKHLNAGGQLLIDFLNADRVVSSLVPESIQEVEGITFHIQRRVEEGQIRKQITFEDKGGHFVFEERVQALRLADFERLLSSMGFRIDHLWGDYKLSPYSPETDRLIISASRA